METKIKKLLEFYDDAYYNKSESLITDYEYDRLKKSYLRVSGKEEYDNVSTGYTTGEERVKHSQGILSLKEYQSTDIEGICNKVDELGYPLYVQPKYDGLTVVIEDGKVSTRGDGEYGDDITENALSIEGVKELLDSGLRVRGEALILKDDFKKLNEELIAEGKEPFKNPRNTASGMLRRKHSKPKYLKIFLYDILGSEMSVEEKITSLSIFTTRDIFVAHSEAINNFDELAVFLSEMNSEDLEEFAFETDGLVIKSGKRDSLNKFGSTNHHPKDAFAIKFPVEGVWTELKGITHQVGRTGKVVPVAELEPVDILGSTVSRATLHNDEIVRAFKLDTIYEGTKVKLIKANEIIPAIIDVKFPDNLDNILGTGTIERCPICSSLLNKINEQQYCENMSCPSKSKLRLEHMAKREALDIKGLSSATVAKLYDNELINDPYDIYDLTIEEIMTMPGFAEKSSTKLYQAIQGSRKVKLENFITSLGINEVGKGTANLIADQVKTIEGLIDDIKNDCELIKEIDGIGPIVINNLKENIDEIIRVKNYFEIKEVEEKEEIDIKGKVCISGKFDISRKELQSLLEEKGYKVVNSITKDCDYLISDGSKTSKYKEAEKRGITIFEGYSKFQS